MRLKNHHSKGRTVPLMGKGGKLVDVYAVSQCPLIHLPMYIYLHMLLCNKAPAKVSPTFSLTACVDIFCFFDIFCWFICLLRASD
jgi:hypothetical protein